MTYSEILHNKHFRRLAAIIRVPYRSQRWRSAHPDVPFWTLIENLDRVTPLDGSWNRHLVARAFTDLIVAITRADERLGYSEMDLDWLIDVLDRPKEEANAILKMLQAYASAPDDLLTIGEVAALTDEAESTWRNRAAAGEIPGAVKKGKTWLLPRSMVIEAPVSKVVLIREAITGNQVSVHPRLDVQLVHGVDQSDDEMPAFIDIRICDGGWTDEEHDECRRRVARIVEMLDSAGINEYRVDGGVIHFLND